MSETPTEPQTSDADQAVNAPDPSDKGWEKGSEQLAAAILATEIEQVERELEQDPVPPGLDAAVKLSGAIREFVQAWPKHVQHVEQNIETPFKRAWTPTPEVFDALLIVSMELGDVLEGIRAPDALLRAAAAIVDDGIVGARQALAVDRCSETLEKWRAVKQDLDEEVLDEAAASEKLDFYSRALINALVEIEPGFRKLDAGNVYSAIRAGRKNQGGVALLLKLRDEAGVWPKASEKSLYRAVEKRSKEVST